MTFKGHVTAIEIDDAAIELLQKQGILGPKFRDAVTKVDEDIKRRESKLPSAKKVLKNTLDFFEGSKVVYGDFNGIRMYRKFDP